MANILTYNSTHGATTTNPYSGEYYLGNVPGTPFTGANALVGTDPGSMWLQAVGTLGQNGAIALMTKLTGKNYAQYTDAATLAKGDFSDLMLYGGGAQTGGVYGWLQKNNYLGNFDPTLLTKSGASAANSKGSGKNWIDVGSSGTPSGVGNLTANAQDSAYQQTLAKLDSWGLGNLADWAWQQISATGDMKGYSTMVNLIKTTPEYKARFPGLVERAAKGLPAMTEQQYMDYETKALDLASQVGLPAGFMSSKEIGTLIANDVSASQLSDRMVKAYQAVSSADQATKDALKQYYGVTTGDLTAYWFNPAKASSLILKQAQAAVIGGIAKDTGFGNLSKSDAEQLAAEQISDNSLTPSYFRSGFQKVLGETPLTTAQVGQANQTTVSQEQLLAQAFPGMNQPLGTTAAGNTTAVHLAEEARVAGLTGGGGYAQNTKGAVGIGRAGTTGVGSTGA